MAGGKTIRLVDVTLRDAHQCLWATRMTTAMMADIAPRLDRAGFEAIDLAGGAVFDVCVRYLREDPWERMRIVSGWVKNTPLIVMTRGQSLFTFEFFPDDIVELTAQRIFANGIRYHTPYDALNDMRNMAVPVRAAKQVGALYRRRRGLYAQPRSHRRILCAQDARTDQARRRRGLHQGSERAAHSGARADAGAGDEGRLRRAAAAAAFALPHRARPAYRLLAVRLGVDVVHTATSTLANGASHPATENFVENARRAGFSVPLDLAPVAEIAERLRYHRRARRQAGRQDRRIRRLPLRAPDARRHGVESEIAAAPLGIAHRLPDVLEEAARVRHDLGYPIIVSPFAQFVMTQAVLNVMGKERYATVPDEVRKYVLGYYGEIAGPIDPNLYDRITRGAAPTKARPGDLIEPGIPRVRRERGPFASDDDLLLAAFYSDGQYKALKAAGPIKTDYPLAATPLVTLLKEIALRPSIRSFHLIKRPALASP